MLKLLQQEQNMKAKKFVQCDDLSDGAARFASFN